ncbi:hypothetical protein RFI_27108 [Reticulomyxa filosa]|uniref:HECT domain-containing protein n=1 Tax=Reticulomyxa filosa TaxID=46433 RepID=X6M8M9_RETFI|nr:hypothetical protein RFI_27108 [Reticulomyxa filosa]|eukprot:ETO10269.1 hypothetical protein RFI_27108 [Reticulomyxa filosa]
MQEHVKNYGGTRLMLPPRNQWTTFLPHLFDNDPDPSRPITEKELKIEYEIRREVFDPVLDDIRTDVLKNRKITLKSDVPIYICAEQSTFDRVVEMSSLTLAVHQALEENHARAIHASDNVRSQPHSELSADTSRPEKVPRNDGYRLPAMFLGEVARNVQVSESHSTIVPHNKPLKLTESEDPSPAKPCPTGGIGEISEFTVMFWLYLDRRSDSTEVRSILRKGDRSGNSLLPWICFPAGNKKNNLQVHVITKANTRITLSHESEELKPKTWKHVAVTGNAVGVKLYLDGKLVQKQRTNGPLKHNNDPIYLGKCRPGVENGFTQPVVHSLGVNGMILDCRYYLRCLSDKSIDKYRLDAQLLAKAPVPSIQFRSKHDPATKSRLSLQYFRNAVMSKVPEFDPIRWNSVSGTNLDHDVIALFENCFQDTGMIDLRDVWKMVGGAGGFDANGNPIENGNEREARNLLRQLSQLDIVAHSLNLGEKLLEKYDALSDIDIQVLKRRYFMLQILNHKMKTIFPLVDFTQVGLSWSLASRLCGLRSLIFSDLKRQPWQNVLQQTSSNNRTSVVINRLRALRARERAATNALSATEASKKSIFGQVYRTLNFVKPVYLRCATGHRPWSIVYEGEGGTDAGGLFRDSLSAISGDLQSDHLMLFIKCPNSRGYGDNQEKWVPNPSCTSSLQLSMYTFVGKLMGVAIRGKHYLNLDLPSLVWKPLVGKQVGREDLKEIDSLCFDILDKLSNIEREGVTPQTFSDYFPYQFTTTSSDGRQVLLKTNGDKIQVTWENRKEYVQLLERYRLNEFTTQVDAIRRGLATIVPIALLPLFTWQELELMVCGKREIDLELLKANTVYKSGVKVTEKHIQYFWDVLEEFTHQQRSNFLRFVWGQSRLPTRSEDFQEQFGIQMSPRNDDNVLPVSRMSLCSTYLLSFFHVLKNIRNHGGEVMKKKLLYAISNCHAIDTDFVAQNVNWEED